MRHLEASNSYGSSIPHWLLSKCARLKGQYTLTDFEVVVGKFRPRKLLSCSLASTLKKKNPHLPVALVILKTLISLSRCV